MVSSPLNSQACYHTRSNSFPSRLVHPLTSQFDEHLRRLNTFESTSSSSSVICHRLRCLQDLYDCVNESILLPLTQRSSAQEQNEKWVDEMLEGSLRLLDLCSLAKDGLLQTKECAHEIHSIMRRRRGGQIELSSEINKHLTSRKVIKRAIHKALKELKAMETKFSSFSTINKAKETVAMFSMLKEVEVVTVSVLESFFILLSWPKPKARSKLGGWSLVSQLMHHKDKRIACKEEKTDVNEFERMDSALHSLVSQKTSKSDIINPLNNVQNQRKELDFCIQDLEEGLECLYRRLIKTRVSFLNILIY